jgi:hypothetical protein
MVCHLSIGVALTKEPLQRIAGAILAAMTLSPRNGWAWCRERGECVV